MAGCYSTTIDRHATFVRVITWTDESDTPVNLTGYSAKMQADGPEEFELSTTNGRISLGGIAGTITLTIDAEDTGDFAAGTYDYDLFLTSGTDVVKKLLCGSIIVRDSVTSFD